MGGFHYDDGGGGVGNYETCAAGVGAVAQGWKALQRSLCECRCPSGRARTGRCLHFPAHADGSMHGQRGPPSSRDDHADGPFRFQ